jgi:thiosulfate reductase cytochrome b subunit
MNKLELHPMPVRIWHWTNAFCFLVLIVTAIQLRYRDLVGIMPLRTAVDVHNFFGFLLTASYFLYFVYYLATGKIRLYLPDLNLKRLLMSMLIQAKYYGYGIFIGDKNPFHAAPDNKFNSLQKLSYDVVMVVLMPLQIITGVLLWDVKGFAKWITMAGGLKIDDTTHVFVSMCCVTFIFIHVYLATLGTTRLEHIKAMFTGYEEIEEQHSH